MIASSDRLGAEVNQMEKELTAIDISHLPQLAHLIAELRRSGTPVVLQEHGEDVAMITSLAPSTTAHARGKPITADDPLWKIVGIGRSGGLGDVSLNKYRYLAEAYTPREK
jgi:hypothetical protein